MNFIFWNVNNNVKAIDLIDSVDFTTQKTVFAIAEFWRIREKFKQLSADKKVWHDEVHGRTGVVYSSSVNLMPYGGEKYFSLYKIQYINKELLLAVIHLKSKLRSESDAISTNLYTIEYILSKLNTLQNENIIILGDFNQPFCNEITNIYHLNATNYYDDNERYYKTCEDVRRVKFYNPIQSFSGDLSKGPPGTYFYHTATQSQAWHIFDNALVSYPLAKYLNREHCEIMSDLNDVALLKNNNRPNKEIFSDHLPVKIKLS